MTLRRSGPLRRITPIKRTKSLLSGSNRLVRSPLRVSRPKVTPEERQGRKALKNRSSGICELDGVNPATDAQHRRNRSQGGTWAVANLLHVCRPCHRHIHANPKAAVQQGWTVLSHRDPARVPVWLARRGYVFLLDTGYIEETEEEESA